MSGPRLSDYDGDREQFNSATCDYESDQDSRRRDKRENVAPRVKYAAECRSEFAGSEYSYLANVTSDTEAGVLQVYGSLPYFIRVVKLIEA